MSVHPLTPAFLRSVQTNLDSGWLLGAIIQMEGTLSQADILFEQTRQLRESYELLLKYLKNGSQDPTRHNQYAQFYRQAYEIYDNLLLRQRRASFESIRSELSHPQTELKPYAISLSFDDLILSDKWTEEDRESFFSLVRLIAIDNNAPLLSAISALTLSLLNIFDAQKFASLFSLFFSESDIQVKIRSMVGVVFSIIKYRKRIHLYDDIRKNVEKIRQDDFFCQHIEALQYQLIQNLRTKTDLQNINEQIMPWLQEHAKQMGNLFTSSDEFAESLSDYNPDWKQTDLAEKIEDKVQDLMAFQKKGTDTFYSTFAQLSRTIPFFDKPENWFCPFSVKHSAFSQTDLDIRLLAQFYDKQHLSDTSRYAFTLFILRMPSSHVKNIFEHIEQAQHMMETAVATDVRQDVIQSIQFYLQDLYRFYTLYKHRELFANPFQLDLHLIDNAYLKELFIKESVLRKFSDIYIKEKDWANGLKYLRLIRPANLIASDFEKSGYCKEKSAQLNEALIDYEQALVLTPDSSWTLQRLAYLYFRLKNYTRSLELYNELFSNDSSNLDYLIKIGECQMYLGNYDAATRSLIKSDYLRPTDDSKRALAWLYLLTENWNKSEQLYQELIHKKPKQTDFLNAGHVALLSGNIAMAIERYSRYLLFDEKKPISNRNLFDQDRDLLIQKGLTTEFLQQISDLVVLH